jgi:hypothetical protein
MSTAAEDFSIALWAIIGSIVIALVISIVVLLITRLFIGCTMWVLIVIFILSCFLISVSTFALLYFSGQVGALESYIEKIGPNRAAQIMKVASNKKILITTAIVSLLLGIFMTVYVCKYRKAISVAMGVLEVAAKFIFRYPSLFVIMILCFVM